MKNNESGFQSILIFGMGMMGSSLSLALKNSGDFHGRVDGIVQSEKSRVFIETHKICDQVFRLEALEDFKDFPLEKYDLIVIGLPVGKILPLAELIPEYRGVITDMSSTRVRVAEAFAKRSDLRFVGSHPMCGSEDAGPSAAKQDLFHNKLCIILEGKEGQGRKKGGAISSDWQDVARFWGSIGMKTFLMKENDHDEVLAYLSHSPHVLAGLISIWASESSAVMDSNTESPIPISGGGFRDMVRIAGSNQKMWTDILETNRESILDSLRHYRNDLDEMILNLENFDREYFMEWFTKARKARNILCGIREDEE
ncbi:MAG: prephenate dehydrogenase/arogenate dehydrogenase family protein [Spirochaetia bacterium]|nr:prephenate dehydrogenase/arogenate dehydrogenase family protein [Spirochaetia bacterium]